MLRRIIITILGVLMFGGGVCLGFMGSYFAAYILSGGEGSGQRNVLLGEISSDLSIRAGGEEQ
jgi:hypothetical protein